MHLPRSGLGMLSIARLQSFAAALCKVLTSVDDKSRLLVNDNPPHCCGSLTTGAKNLTCKQQSAAYSPPCWAPQMAPRHGPRSPKLSCQYKASSCMHFTSVAHKVVRAQPGVTIMSVQSMAQFLSKKNWSICRVCSRLWAPKE